ncbi:MAG: DUF1638 domain-containing protein [Pseudomonadota bacterium]
MGKGSMGVIGIICCEILELEFAHMLAMDTDLERVVVLEDRRSLRLIEGLAAKACRNLRRIPHIQSFLPEPAAHLEVVVRVLEVALHRSKKTLQRALVQAAHELDGHVDAFLLGYGLCGNALENVPELLDVSVPVFVPMDNDHPVDDCVGLLIGGRDCYYAEQCKVPGTVFMIPGFTNHLSRIVRENPRDTDHHGLKRMFTRYERSLLVVTPVMREEEMRRNAEEFNALLGLRTEVRPGALKILDETWRTVKEYLKNKDG